MKEEKPNYFYIEVPNSEHYTNLQMIIESLKHGVPTDHILTLIERTIEMGGNITFPKTSK